MSLRCKAPAQPAHDALGGGTVLVEQLLGQELFERLGRQMALEHALVRHGDGARLLGDDDHQGVGGLAYADAGAMAGAKVGAHPGILRQGQHAAGGDSPLIADDQRAVVQGGLGEENIAQQLLGDPGVDERAGGEVLVQGDGALEDDQRAHALDGHLVTGAHDLVDHVFVLRGLGAGGEQAEDPLAADALQSAPQLRLKNDDQGEAAQLQHVAQHVVQRVHLQQPGQAGYQQDQQNAARDPGRRRLPDQNKDPVEQIGHDQNVDDIHNSRLRYQIRVFPQ